MNAAHFLLLNRRNHSSGRTIGRQPSLLAIVFATALGALLVVGGLLIFSLF